MIPTGRAYPRYFVVINDWLFFMADSMSVKQQLFKTDGTEEGTEWIANVGDANTLDYNFTSSGGLLYYRTARPETGTEHWASDGTSDGTGMVKDICEGTWSSFPGHLTDFNGTLIFTAEECGIPGDLYRTDGTAANTVKIGGRHSSGLRAFGDTLYFKTTF